MGLKKKCFEFDRRGGTPCFEMTGSAGFSGFRATVWFLVFDFSQKRPWIWSSDPPEWNKQPQVQFPEPQRSLSCLLPPQGQRVQGREGAGTLGGDPEGYAGSADRPAATSPKGKTGFISSCSFFLCFVIKTYSFSWLFSCLLGRYCQT